MSPLWHGENEYHCWDRQQLLFVSCQSEAAFEIPDGLYEDST